MRTIKSVKEFREVRRALDTTSTNASNTKRLGFVPTMGALHQGHVSLLDRAKKECDVTVLSIFLNPTQFNNPNDLDIYPVTLAQDLEKAERAGVDLVLLPNYDELYADNFRFQINENQFSKKLCGAHRDGHFTGVLSIVMKLLNIVRPDKAYFGEKDYQQYQLVKDMAQAFFLDVDIIGCETVREADGLAMSSRNTNLEVAARALAPKLHQLISEKEPDEIVAHRLQEHGFTVDYIETIEGRRYAAANLGPVRLIDNIQLSHG
jgi:pantoate--beta-alanine ligase